MTDGIIGLFIAAWLIGAGITGGYFFVGWLRSGDSALGRGD